MENGVYISMFTSGLAVFLLILGVFCWHYRGQPFAASDIYDFRCPDRIPTAGTNILPTAGLFKSGRNSAVLISGNKNIGQASTQNEVQQIITGAGNGPAIFIMMRYSQSVGFRCCFKSFVVIRVVPTGVFNSIFITIQMAHFMKQSSGNIFNRSCQSSGSDI